MKQARKVFVVGVAGLFLFSLGAWFASNHPGHPIFQLGRPIREFLEAPSAHIRWAASILRDTHGLGGKWRTCDPSDPPMMLEVWVGMLNCEITETMPDGSRKRTLFTDQRHPSIATGMTILTDGDRYLEIGKSKDRLRLIVPDGNWEPFKGHDGRTQYKQNTKTIALVRA